MSFEFPSLKMISVLCPGCNGQLTGAEEMAGQQVQCPKCGTAMVIPRQVQVPRGSAATAKRQPSPWLKVGLLVLLAIVVLIGGILLTVFLATRGTPQKDSQRTEKAVITEAEARSRLTAALESWLFADSHKKFERTHPDVEILDREWWLGTKLRRYEIRSARQTDSAPIARKSNPGQKAYVFFVALELEDRPFVDRRSVDRRYVVDYWQGKWRIDSPLD